MKGDLSKRRILRCCEASPWDLGNKVLYDLCRKRPDHKDTSAIVAKIWLIGRAYAAAIERRREKEGQNDDFYLKVVAPRIRKSKIDAWISNASKSGRISHGSLAGALSAHLNVTKLFNQISGLDKRSLASKYLHFHKPDLFYIFDTRACVAMRSFSKVVGRATKMTAEEKRTMDADLDYKRFSEKCLRLTDHISKTTGITLSPRQLDTLFLDEFRVQQAERMG